jgi:hypothetical protein
MQLFLFQYTKMQEHNSVFTNTLYPLKLRHYLSILADMEVNILYMNCYEKNNYDCKAAMQETELLLLEQFFESQLIWIGIRANKRGYLHDSLHNDQPHGKRISFRLFS